MLPRDQGRSSGDGGDDDGDNTQKVEEMTGLPEMMTVTDDDAGCSNSMYLFHGPARSARFF